MTDLLNETARHRFFGLERHTPQQKCPGIVRTNDFRQPARAENDAESETRHAEAGIRRCNPPVTRDDQIGRCSIASPVHQREGGERGVVDPLQQLLHPHEPKHQIAVARILEAAQIETAGKSFSLRFEHAKTRPA